MGGGFVLEHTAECKAIEEGEHHADHRSSGNVVTVNAGVQSQSETGLTNKSHYYYAIFARDTSLNYSAVATFNMTPYVPTSSFYVIAASGNSKVNVTIADTYTEAIVRYATDTYPVSENAGIDSGLSISASGNYMHNGLTNGTKYYYSLFYYHILFYFLCILLN